MKKLLLLAISIALFSSCEIKEEITFNKDGSGEYQMLIDMGRFLEFGKKMDSKKKDSLSKEKKPVVKDSLFKFSDFLNENKDSIANLPKKERELLKGLEDVIVKIHMDEPKGEMTVAYFYPFQKPSDLTNIMQRFEKIENNSKKTGLAEDFLNNLPKTSVEYKFSKKKFHRKVKVLKTKNEDEKTEQENKKIKEILPMFHYKLVYHFPKKIKSVSYKDALLSTDGKTLIIDIPFDKIAENPKLLDFEVKF
jgi:hypothetical protein